MDCSRPMRASCHPWQRRLPFLGGVLLLAACASELPPETAPDTVGAALNGVSRQQLVACAGPPDRVRTVAGREVLVYERGGETARSGTDIGVGLGVGVGSSSGVGAGIGFSTSSPLRSQAFSDLCEVSVTIVDGAVAAVRYRAESGVGSRRYTRCREVTSRCVPSR